MRSACNKVQKRNFSLLYSFSLLICINIKTMWKFESDNDCGRGVEWEGKIRTKFFSSQKHDNARHARMCIFIENIYVRT